LSATQRPKQTESLCLSLKIKRLEHLNFPHYPTQAAACSIYIAAPVN
jgi:hypothetical protein